MDRRSLVSRRHLNPDLLLHLNVVPVRLPPLRERMEDIPLLVETFSDHFRVNSGLEPDEEIRDSAPKRQRLRGECSGRHLRYWIEGLLTIKGPAVVVGNIVLA